MAVKILYILQGPGKIKREHLGSDKFYSHRDRLVMNVLFVIAPNTYKSDGRMGITARTEFN